MLTKAPKGTRDALPNEIGKWQFVENRFREVAGLFGFEEIRTPTLEHTELFARGIGDSTDVVEKQMYTFTDYGGRSVTLRPEGTAGVARAFVENKMAAGVRPLKLWYEISCFRYEKPQSGRLREFHQFGVEVFGSKDMLADADVIAVADTFLRGLGLRELELRVNSIGCPVCRPVYRKRLTDYLEGHYDELCDTCKGRLERNPMRVLDCKSPVCGQIAAGAPVMLDSLCDECREDFAALKENLESYGIAYTVDPMIVRGLDYYTKTAFEFVSQNIGAQGTVCGGGRYDSLVSEIGGAKPGSDGDVPGVGFGLGIERLLLVMEASGIALPGAGALGALVVFLSEKEKTTALEIASGLRRNGISAAVDDCGRGMKAQFKYADRIGAKYVVVIGEEELATRKATVKEMLGGGQEKIPFDELAGYLKAYADEA